MQQVTLNTYEFQGTKIYGKSSLRFVPLIGWIWVFTESIFLRRVWESDKKTLVRDLQFVEQYPKDYNVSVSMNTNLVPSWVLKTLKYHLDLESC